MQAVAPTLNAIPTPPLLPNVIPRPPRPSPVATANERTFLRSGIIPRCTKIALWVACSGWVCMCAENSRESGSPRESLGSSTVYHQDNRRCCCYISTSDILVLRPLWHFAHPLAVVRILARQRYRNREFGGSKQTIFWVVQQMPRNI